MNSLLANADAFGFPLLALVVDAFGLECLSWHSATLLLELRSEFGYCHPLAFEKLLAAASVLTRDDFYTSLPDFCRICLALSGETVAIIPDCADCAWGMTEAMLIQPPESDEPYSEEIRVYLGRILDSEGILFPPDVLRLALRDRGDLAAQVRWDYVDDPEMLAAMAGVEKDRAEAIEKSVRIRLRMLLEQLESLDLENSNSKGVARRLLRKLSEQDDAPN